eukprot:jgi/Orpsp1_1/1179013/evm.model.c7180000067583.1
MLLIIRNKINNGEDLTTTEKKLLIEYYEEHICTKPVTINKSKVMKIDIAFINDLIKEENGKKSPFLTVTDVYNKIENFIAQNEEYFDKIEKMKKNFNDKYNSEIDINEDLICDYINYKKLLNGNIFEVEYATISDIINTYLKFSDITNKEGKIKIDSIKNLAKCSFIEHVHPIGTNGNVIAFNMDKSHLEEDKEIRKIIENNNGDLCSTKKTKRDNDINCIQCSKFNTNINIKSFLRNTLEKFEEFDSHILSNNIENIENLKGFYYNAESFDDLWKKMLSIYENNMELNKIDEKTSTEFITNMYYIIGEYKKLLSNSEHNNNEYIKNVNRKSIEKMESYFDKVYKIHKDKDYGKIMEGEDEHEISIKGYISYDIESKLYREELIDIIRILVNIVNKNDINENYLGVIHIGNKILSTIDYKTIMPESKDIVDTIEKLISKFNNEETKITENERNKLMEIYFKLTLLNIYNHDDNAKNIDLVNYLIESIGKKKGMVNSENSSSSYILRPENISL